MVSFTSLYTQCQTDSADFNNKAYFQARLNEAQKIAENELDNFTIEETRTGNTIAGVAQIPTPENYIRAKFFYVTNSPSRYDAQFIYAEDHWQRIVAFQQSVQSNYLQFVFPRITVMELYPTPASSLPYTFQYVAETPDMQYDDYSSGTVATITNTFPTNALPYATVVGANNNSQAWPSYFAGMYFQMAGDRQWYPITGVTTGGTPTLTLGAAYNGIVSSNVPQYANLQYTIGQMPRLPEALHSALPMYALYRYYLGIKKDMTKMKMWKEQWDYWLAWGKATFASRTEMGVIPSQRNLRRFNTRNPNLFPMTISGGTDENN